MNIQLKSKYSWSPHYVELRLGPGKSWVFRELKQYDFISNILSALVMVLRICRDYWPFSKSIKNVQFRFQIALLAVLFTAPFLKFMTSNSGLCSEAKGSEKKPKLARIAVGKVIVESPVVSCSICFFVCLIWSWAFFYGSLSKVFDLEFLPMQ